MATATLNQLNIAKALRFAAEATITSNGPNAKTAKVKLVARTSNVVNDEVFGPVYHDFAGMSVKPKIPIDYNHDFSPIGYLNNFDTSTGELVCSGAIVLVDDEGESDVDVMALASRMDAGVPYEASIFHCVDEDTLMEFVPEGYTASVNGQSIQGPATVFREWTLKGVSICPFGKDANTSATIEFSAAKKQKGFFIRFTKQNVGDIMNQDNTNSPVVAEEAKAVETAAEANANSNAVEAPVEAQSIELSEPAKAEATVAVEAVATDFVQQEETPVEVKANAEAPKAESAKSENVDTRSEFKRFVAAFGERASTYFADGKSFEDATAEHLKFQAEQIDTLNKRLSAIDRGADKPVTFSDSSKREAAPTGLQSVIRMGNKKLI